MSNNYQIFLISDSTGETLDRIFLSLKAQFKNIEYKVNSYSFTRTENQILKILDLAKNEPNSIYYVWVCLSLGVFEKVIEKKMIVPLRFSTCSNLFLSFSDLFGFFDIFCNLF